MLQRLFSNILILSVFFAGSFSLSCGPTKREKTIGALNAVTGIKFIEIRREFNTGLSFNKDGFQQIPEWMLYFLPGDSVKIYSPFKKRYVYYPIIYDHNDVVNFAREWLRIKHVSKDSMVLQLLQVRDRKVLAHRSNIYMKFYSESYLRDSLRQHPDSLRKPSHKDSLHVMALVKKANKHSHIADSVFFAHNPVMFQSKSPYITVIRDTLSAENKKSSQDYWNPGYTIIINKAYKDFAHNFSALVDKNCKITVQKFAVLDPEFEASRRRVLQGIVDVYFYNLLKITPGSTMGMRHATEVMLHVKGISNK